VLLLALCAAMSAAAPDSVAALERLAPQARWTREPLPGLDAEVVVLPTKAPNQFVIARERVAVATLEDAAPLFAPLDAARAQQVVAALERAELVPVEALARLRAAGFVVTGGAPAAPPGPFVVERLELRSPQSEPCVAAVALSLDERGHVERREAVLACLPAAPAPADNAPPLPRAAHVDRSAELKRFVGAARGRSP
jgi:hypothetical protein